MKLFLSIFLAFFLIFFQFPKNSLALYKPYIKIQQDRENYEKKVATYSPENQQKLKNLSDQIIEINNRRVSELTKQMEAQAAILDEYQRRTGTETSPQIEKARYWLTYAHEAVAFQLVQVYIFNLTSQNSIKNDATITVNKFKSDLSATRTKVINSQNIIEKLVAQ